MPGDVEGILREFNSRTKTRVNELADSLEQQLQAAAAPHRKTGEMARNTRVDVIKTASGYRIRAESTTPQAVWLNDGTRPHVIFPRRAKALAWKGAGGVMIFAARVNHPGSKATHWFSNVMSSANVRASIARLTRR